MKSSNINSGFAHRAGYVVGIVLNTYLKKEARFTAWARGRGVPKLVAMALMWSVKLGIAGLLLYLVYWLALIAGFLLVVGLVGRSALISDENDSHGDACNDEWRNGHSGYGRYVNNFFVDEL